MITQKVIVWVTEIIIVTTVLFAVQLPLRRKPLRAGGPSAGRTPAKP